MSRSEGVEWRVSGRQEEVSRGIPGFYSEGCARSTVVSIGRDWMARAASGDGVVSRFQGTRRWRRWLAGSRAARAVSEREWPKWWAVGACQCLAVQGEGGVGLAARCRAGVCEGVRLGEAQVHRNAVPAPGALVGLMA
jgi:hypothetical protein